MATTLLDELRLNLRRSISEGAADACFRATHDKIVAMSSSNAGLLTVAENIKEGRYLAPWYYQLDEAGDQQVRNWARGIVYLSDWEDRSPEEFETELRRIYEVHYPDKGRGYDRISFDEMVRMFANDDFFNGHFLARQHLLFASLGQAVDS